MGENFLKRKNDRFLRERDQRLNEQLAPDIFSLCDADTELTLLAIVSDAVSVADELWAPKISFEGPIRFYYGDRLITTIDGTEADLLRKECGDESPVIARIIEVDDMIARLKIVQGKVK